MRARVLSIVVAVLGLHLVHDTHAQQPPPPPGPSVRELAGRLDATEQQRNAAFSAIAVYSSQLGIVQEELNKQRARADAAETKIKELTKGAEPIKN